MRRVRIVSTRYDRARDVARAHHLWPWQWTYVAGVRDLRGLGKNDTVFIDGLWRDTQPVVNDLYFRQEMGALWAAGVEIVLVDA